MWSVFQFGIVFYWVKICGRVDAPKMQMGELSRHWNVPLFCKQQHIEQPPVLRRGGMLQDDESFQEIHFS